MVFPFRKEVRAMRSLEKIEIAVFGVPTRRDVLERLRRDESCRADPLSLYCTFASGRGDYLFRDMPGSKVCERCPRFEAARQNLTASWEEWVLAMQDVFT
jgi:hypothetical protein